MSQFQEDNVFCAMFFFPKQLVTFNLHNISHINIIHINRVYFFPLTENELQYLV